MSCPNLLRPVDGEYKQKSATQTPSGHLSTTSEVEISCKPGSTSGAGIAQANSADSGTYQSSKVSPPRNFASPKSFNYSRATLWRTPRRSIAMTNALISFCKFLKKIPMLLEAIWDGLENKLVIIAMLKTVRQESFSVHLRGGCFLKEFPQFLSSVFVLGRPNWLILKVIENCDACNYLWFAVTNFLERTHCFWKQFGWGRHIISWQKYMLSWKSFRLVKQYI